MLDALLGEYRDVRVHFVPVDPYSLAARFDAADGRPIVLSVCWYRDHTGEVRYICGMRSRGTSFTAYGPGAGFLTMQDAADYCAFRFWEYLRAGVFSLPVTPVYIATTEEAVSE